MVLWFSLQLLLPFVQGQFVFLQTILRVTKVRMQEFTFHDAAGQQEIKHSNKHHQLLICSSIFSNQNCWNGNLEAKSMKYQAMIMSHHLVLIDNM